MTKNHICDKCGLEMSSKQSLLNHQEANVCTKEKKKYQCPDCKVKFSRRNTLNYHRKKFCKGKQITVCDRDDHIQGLQKALAASHGLKANIEEKQSSPNNIHNENNFQNCHVGDVNNIQINITVLPIGEENIDHLKGIALEDLRRKIGLKAEASTMIELFKLIRLDADHPENHNLLLTSKDSDKIHYYDGDGWKEGKFDEQMRMALLDDKYRLRDFIGMRQWDDKFYWGYLEHHVGQKINERDDIALKPIYDGIRIPLLESTLKLAAKHDEQSIQLSSRSEEICNTDANSDLRTVDNFALAMQQSRERETLEKTKQMELELEILRLKAKML